MTFIDTHSHLYDDQFDADREEVVQRAFDAGASKIFLPNINAETVVPMLQLSQRFPGRLYPMLGLHPEDLGETWRQVLTSMEKLLQVDTHPFIAIGEVGLDYYWDRSLYAEQQEAFDIQVGWAVKYGLPLMIHTRKAQAEVVNILRSRSKACSSRKEPLAGVFHCFSGSAEEARELLRFDGFMLGIGGVLTFKKSRLPDVLRQAVPLERIVVETDSPYLAPTPHRGKRNESAFIVEVLRTLAEIYALSMDEVAAITSENALKTFPKARL